MVSRNDPHCISAYDLEIGKKKGTRLPYYRQLRLFHYVTASKYEAQRLCASCFDNSKQSIYNTVQIRITVIRIFRAPKSKLHQSMRGLVFT